MLASKTIWGGKIKINRLEAILEAEAITSSWEDDEKEHRAWMAVGKFARMIGKWEAVENSIKELIDKIGQTKNLKDLIDTGEVL